jgi:glycerol-3-phosphate dehydrogenase (NAD(P)+)
MGSPVVAPASMGEGSVHVTVLGAGSWGTTVASLVAGRHPTMIWARDPVVAESIRGDRRNPRYLSDFTLPSGLDATDDLAKAVGQAELLIVGVPSHAFRATLEAARPNVHPWIPIVSLTKGLEQGSLLRMTQIVKEVLPGHPAAALTGPNIAREIMAGNAAASVIATEDLDVAAALQRTMQRGLLRIYTNHDVVGCELGGVLKNVVAIACGIAQGLDVGDNTRAAVMTRGLAELTRLGVALGGVPATFAGLTGMGDLVATCISPYSRNRQVGERLGRGETLAEVLGSMTMVAEGVKAAVTVHELAQRLGIEMPVCEEIYRVVTGEAAAADAYRGLRRQAGHEADPG